MPWTCAVTPSDAGPRPPARRGDTLDTVETPTLLVDLDLLESNLDRMAEAARTAGMRLRPHGKAHKCPEIARMQMVRGAVGICCQKVAEAEAFAAAGIADILVTNEVVDPRKLARLATLGRTRRIGLLVDDALHVARAAEAAGAAGTSFDVYVEIEVGQGRCGVVPGPIMVDLARQIAASPSLRFAGLQAYDGGAQHLHAAADRKARIENVALLANRARDLLASAGLRCPLVTGAGTGTFPYEAASGVFGELQCGSYALMDAEYARLQREGDDGFAPALTLLATVISAARPDRAVLDVGLKGQSIDAGFPVPTGDAAGAEVVSVSDEHTVLRLPDGMRLRPGDRVSLIPGHVDPTCNLHDWIIPHRGGIVETPWRIAGRNPGL